MTRFTVHLNQCLISCHQYHWDYWSKIIYKKFPCTSTALENWTLGKNFLIYYHSSWFKTSENEIYYFEYKQFKLLLIKHTDKVFLWVKNSPEWKCYFNSSKTCYITVQGYLMTVVDWILKKMTQGPKWKSLAWLGLPCIVKCPKLIILKCNLLLVRLHSLHMLL